MSSSRVFFGALAVAAWWLPGVALGQSKSEGQRAREDVRSALDVDGLILQASYNVSSRYNLNESQHSASEAIFQKYINKFLVEHQDEIYPLIRDIVRHQGGTDKLSPEQIKRIGKMAEPLIDKAYEAIKQANQEWVDKLNLSPQQQALLEWDFKEMDRQFEDIRENFRTMANDGKFVKDPMFPQTEPASEPPPLPKQPPDPNGPKVSDKPAVDTAYDATAFDVVVDQFIKDYELDAAQIETAESLRREYKQRALDYHKSKKEAYDDIARRKKQAREKSDFEAIKKAEQEEDTLNAHITELLTEMKSRLMALPREWQKLKYEEKLGKTPESSDKSGAEKSETATPPPPTPKEVPPAKPKSEPKTDEKPGSSEPK